MIQRGDPPEKTARYCLEALAAVLDKMCGGLLQELGDLPVLFSGGVCSNSLLRQRLCAKYGAAFAAPEFLRQRCGRGCIMLEKRSTL